MAQSASLQSVESCPHGPEHRSTTPWMACVPKWMLAGAPKAMVTFEYFTSAPPKTQIVSGDGLPNGAGLPLPVMVAVPVITKPSVIAGLNFGQAVVQSELTTPSVMLM